MIGAVGNAATNSLFQMLKLLGTLLFVYLVAWIITSYIRSVMIMRKRRHEQATPSEGLDVTDIAAGLTREELKKIVETQKEREEPAEEKIDLETYEELPLKPKVYFDPEKDLQEEARPRIQRSFVSNVPIKTNDDPEALTGLPPETAGSTETSATKKKPDTGEPLSADLAKEEEKPPDPPSAPQPHPFQK